MHPTEPKISNAKMISTPQNHNHSRFHYQFPQAKQAHNDEAHFHFRKATPFPQPVNLAPKKSIPTSQTSP